MCGQPGHEAAPRTKVLGEGMVMKFPERNGVGALGVSILIRARYKAVKPSGGGEAHLMDPRFLLPIEVSACADSCSTSSAERKKI